jgi:hypothetical protein
MRAVFLISSVSLVLVAALDVSGCAVSSFDNGGGFASADGGSTSSSSSGGDMSSGSIGVASDSGPPVSTGKTLLYAHTDTTLYELDADNLSAPMKTIGDFDCVGGSMGSMTDIGVTKDGKLFGVSTTAAYPLTVQGSTVHCEATWPLPANSRFYGLTVAPENTVAAGEVLIAANGAGELYQVDANTGNTTQMGTLGKDPQGVPYQLSGDIVFLANAGNPVGFATVRTCNTAKPPKCATTDTLIEVDVKAVRPGIQSVLKSTRGLVKKGNWCTNAASPATFGSMFGIAAFKDQVFGFSRAGDFIEIHNNDGTACLISSNTMDKFAGAGVTTSALVIAPPR